MPKNKSVQHTSDNELTHSMAHYLLTIHKLKEEKGYARVTDIAKSLGITKGSVSTALSNLKKRDLIEEDESKFLSLSESGHDEVHNILSVRTLMFYFLRDILGVPEEEAQKDSCLVEHLLSSETREKLFGFMKKVTNEEKIKGFTSELDLTEFSTHNDFVEAQKGDTHLS